MGIAFTRNGGNADTVKVARRRSGCISVTACAGPRGSGPYGRPTLVSPKVGKGIAPGWAPAGFPPSGVAPGVAPNGHPWPAALTRLLPRSPLRNASTRPAPTSRQRRLHYRGIKQNKAKALDLDLLRKTHRRRRTRLGRRSNAGDAEPGSEAGRRASADGPWTALRRGPVERRRSEGTRRAKPGAMAGLTPKSWTRNVKNSSPVFEIVPDSGR